MVKSTPGNGGAAIVNVCIVREAGTENGSKLRHLPVRIKIVDPQQKRPPTSRVAPTNTVLIAPRQSAKITEPPSHT